MASDESALVYRVFMQRSDTRLDIAALMQTAERFFRARVGFMEPKRYGETPPLVDLSRIAVAPRDRDAVSRSLFVRPATEEDRALADALERERGAGGLGTLARRCPLVAEVERTSPDDAVALLLAAIVASTFLGPIVDAEGRDIFGVKTAKVRLGDLI